MYSPVSLCLDILFVCVCKHQYQLQLGWLPLIPKKLVTRSTLPCHSTARFFPCPEGLTACAAPSWKRALATCSLELCWSSKMLDTFLASQLRHQDSMHSYIAYSIWRSSTPTRTRNIQHTEWGEAMWSMNPQNLKIHITLASFLSYSPFWCLLMFVEWYLSRMHVYLLLMLKITSNTSKKCLFLCVWTRSRPCIVKSLWKTPRARPVECDIGDVM